MVNVETVLDSALDKVQYCRHNDNLAKEDQWPVVQSWFSVKPGLKYNPLFQFVCLNASFSFKT